MDTASPSLRNASQPEPLNITAVVLTFNEESNLEACLQSISGWTQAIYVIDSGSTDRTPEIAAHHGAELMRHEFQSHTEQWQWALAQLPASSTWVLALDADQRITAELRNELTLLFRDNSAQLDEVDGLYINRRQVFRGKWIKHGGYYPKYLMKLFRRDRVTFDSLDLVDHHFYVKGPSRKLRFDLIEQNHKEDDISFWIDKHNRYAVRLAEEELRRRSHQGPQPVFPSLLGSPDQRSLWLKTAWSRLPLYIRPVIYFTYRYIFQLGFLDGKTGFIFHVLQAFWFRLLIDINLEQLKSARRRSGTE
ncbi:MAG TPA: glycosyltransferase family 2 protein [Bryobacteraceae bacterium]|nr:glycosyltransferase family 2 protein [Bryobacteraceae bacterium]